MAKNPFSNTTNTSKKKTTGSDDIFSKMSKLASQNLNGSSGIKTTASKPSYQSKVERPTVPTVSSAVGSHLRDYGQYAGSQPATSTVDPTKRKQEIEARLKQIQTEYSTTATVLSGYQRGNMKQSNAYAIAKTKADQLLAERSELEKELQAVYDQMVSDGGYREANFIDNTVNSFKRGYNQSLLGKESYDSILGKENEKQKYEDILAGDEYAFVPSNKFEQGVSGVMEQIGQQFVQATDPRSLAMAGTAGAAAFVAGQAGPQVLVPEEVVSVPSAMLTGWQMGSAMSNFEIEAGLAYNEMLENGVSEETAKKVALAVGGVNAALEMVQLDELTKSFKILKNNPATASAADTLGKRLLDVGVDVAKNVGKETAQEVAQEGSTIAGTQFATKHDTGEWAYNTGEVVDRLGDTAVSSALTFGMMNVPHAVVGTQNAVRADRIGSNYNADIDALIDEGLQSDQNSESYKKASEFKARRESGGTVSNTEAYDLAAANQQAINTENKLTEANRPRQAVESSVETTPVQSRVQTIQTRLTESGMETARAEAVATSVDRILSGDTSVTNKDKDALSVGNAAARAIFEEETGIKLPASNSSTRKAVSEYIAQTALKQQKQESTATVQENRTVENQTPVNVMSTEAVNQLKSNAFATTSNSAEATLRQAAEVASARSKVDNAVTVQSNMTSLGNNGQRVYAKHINNAKSVSGYSNAFQRYYDAGQIGLPFESIKTAYDGAADRSVLYEAYIAGQNDASDAGKGKHTAKNKIAQKGKKTPSKGKGRFYDSRTGEGKAVDEKTSSALKQFAKVFNVDIELVDSIPDSKGRSIANGYYKNGKIVLAADSDNPLITVMKHEVTHHIQKTSPKQYKAFKDYVMKAYYENSQETMNAEIQRRIDLAALNNLKLTRSEAMDEIVADATEKFLTDRDSIDALVRENRSLAETILNAIRDVLKKIEAAMKGADLKGYSDFMNADQLKQAEKMWVEALTAAAIEDDAGIQYDSASESFAPVWSLKTWGESDYVKARDEAAAEMAKMIGISQKKAKAYIDSVNSIAKIIADDRGRLDYEASPGRSSFVSNSEYGGSFDFSTLCKKRRLLTGTFTAIQKALPNTALTADEILEIRSMMAEAGLEVSCGLCYVEGSRANMGGFTKEFIRLYKKYNPGKWYPDMATMNTPDGIEWVRINHPEVYAEYEKFWNNHGKLRDGDPNLFASQQKPKLYQLHTEYQNEILKSFKKDETVSKKNENGGIRLQSFSDFEIVHLLDTMQVIMDMSRVGLAGQAYTKVPDFAWALGDTGLKINLSLIAKGVDEKGKLIFDDREGMAIEDAMALRNRYSKNVGTIIVTFTDDQLKAAMADDRIDFIIPFHRSQWKKRQYGAMGLPANTKDYTNQQNEKLIKKTYHEYRGRMVPDKATNYMPNAYWDFSKSGKENAEHYLKMCAENNKRPKFYKFLHNNGDGSYSLQPDGSTDGYWKLLIDFKMYDNDGKGSPQMPVKPDFNMEESQRMLNEYAGGHEQFPVAHGIVDEFVSKYKAQKNTTDDGGVQYSLKGYTADGTEVYETSPETLALPWSERRKVFKDLMSNQYRGRTARFYNDRTGEYDYATFSKDDVGKSIHGNKRSDPAGRDAFVNTGADGSVFDLVENAKHDGYAKERGKTTKAHKGVSMWDYYVKTVQIDGIVFDMNINVRQRHDGEFVYSVQLNENKNKTPAPILARAYNHQGEMAGRQSGSHTDVSVNSMPQPDGAVKQYSLKDTNYMDAVKRGDMETAQQMVTEAARENGYTPVKRYHQTSGGFTRFSTDNPKAALHDSETPNGIFFKDNDHDIGLEGKVQMQAYLKANNMLHFRNREEANRWYCDNVDGYAHLQDEYNAALKPFLDELDEIEKKMFDKDTTEEEYAVLDEKEEKTIDEMSEVEDSYRGRLRDLLNDHFLDGTSGYDGIELDYDGHRWVNGKRENVHTYIVFDPAQAKSADPVTYDDNGNVIPLSERFNTDDDDIRYQLKTPDEMLDVAEQLRHEAKAVTDADIMSQAIKDIAKTDAEKKIVGDYQRAMKKLATYEQDLAVYEATKAEHGKHRSVYTDASGKVKKSGVKYSAAEKAEIQQKVNWWRNRLKEIEQKAEFQKILKREKAEMAKTHAKKMAKLRDVYDQRLRDVRAKRDEKIEAEKQKMRDYKQHQRDSKEYKALKGKLEADVKWLDERLRHPTDAKHIPEEFKKGVAAFLNSLDFETKYTDSYTVRNGVPSQKVIDLRAMREVYENILKDQSSTMELDEIQLEALRELEKICANKRVADLDYAELGLVRDAIQYIKMSVSVADKAFNAEIKESISAMGEALIQEQRSKKVRKNAAGIVGEGDKLINYDNVAPADKFHEFGGVMEKLYHQIRKGFDQHINNVQTAISYTQKLTEGNEVAIKAWSGDKAKATKFQISDGTTIELTPAQVMSLYCLMKRDQAVGHVLGSGIVPSGVVVKEAKKFGKLKINTAKKISAERASRCTIDDIQKIVDTMTDDQKKIADGVMNLFTTKCADWGNETSMKLYGYKKFLEPNYFPIRSSDAYLNARFDDSGDVLIKNLGFTKNTVVNANNPIVVEDIFDVLADHVNKMSMYNALVVPLTDFTRVFNYKSKDSDNTIYDSVQKALETSGGTLGIQYIKQFMKDVNKQANSLAAESFINQSISRYKKAKIAASARVLLQQPTAITRAAAMVDPKYLIKGLQQKANYEEMFNHSEIAYWKSLGFYQTDMGRNMKDILLDNETALDRLTMGMYGKADDFAWGHLWNAIKLEQADAHPGMDKASTEFMDLVADRFEEVVDRTQVVDSVFHRSQMMRAPGAATKVASAFMAEPTKAFNLLRTDLIDSINSKDYSKIKRSAVTYVANAIAVSVFAGIADMIRDDEDEDDEGNKRSLWDKYRDASFKYDADAPIYKRLSGNIVDNINPLGMIPYVKEINSMIQGYDVSRMEMASLAEFVKTAKKWTQDKYSYPYLIKETAEDISEMFGVPLKNAIRDMTALVRTAGDIVGGNYYADYAVDKMKYSITNSDNRSVFYKHYTDALLAGDEKAAAMILEDMVINGIPYENIVSRGYQKQKEAAFSEARKLITAGKTDEAKALIKDLAKRYGKKYTTLWKAVKSGDAADLPEETYGFKDLQKAIRKGEDTELIEDYLTEYGGYSEEDLEEAVKLLTEKYK